MTSQPDVTETEATVEERVARHLAANDWQIDEDYVAYAREVLAIVRETVEQQIGESIEQAVYEYRELTCQWDETDGSTQEIARRATQAALGQLAQPRIRAAADATGDVPL